MAFSPSNLLRVAFVPETGNNFQVPSYGYTYELSGYPQVRQPYFENSNDSWIYPTTTERRVILTGAEGGFAAEEAEMAAKAGAKTVGLGPRILRCETAPLAVLSAVMTLTGNLE